MICLGIESTAHTFGVGIVNSQGKVLANSKHTLITKQGGLIPRNLIDHHMAWASKIVVDALEKAGIDFREIDVISFSQGPGIGQALKTGAVTAKTLSLLHNKPLLGVNHCIAHIEIGKKLTGCKSPITCYVSGANTQVIGFESGRYRVYGETLDIGLGNLLDSFGRKLGLGFPAGPRMDELYLQAKNYIALPYTVKGMDLVFSGLQTAAEQKIETVNRNDLVYSLMHNSFAMLIEVTERALAHAEKNELLLAGGVAASPILQRMLAKMCKEREARMFVPERQFLVDNGAMIAWLGLLMFEHNVRTAVGKDLVQPRQRTDQVEVGWIK